MEKIFVDINLLQISLVSCHILYNIKNESLKIAISSWKYNVI